MPDTSLPILFLAGLLGGGHCIGMCGGIVTALTLNLPAGLSRFRVMAGYNLGRIASYVLIGALLGGLSAAGLTLGHARPLQLVLLVVADLMLVFMGLYLAGLSHGLLLIERLGQPVWRRLQPLLRHILPIRTLPGALLAGALWGWLPCGLVYSASITALASASATQGALCMLAFGLGTLPNLLAMGLFADTLRGWMQKRPVRLATGLAVTLAGSLQLVHALSAWIAPAA